MNAHYEDCLCRNCKPGLDQNHFAKDFPDIKWNTKPLLANPLLFWQDYWNGKTWIRWHKLLKDKFGLVRANEVLIEWWEKAPVVSMTTDLRTFDDEFIKYAKENEFYNALFKGLGGLVGKTATLANKTVKTATKAVDAAGNVVETAGDTLGFLGNNLKWVLGGLLAIVLLYVASQIYFAVK
jgi:hypothetical protein